MFSDVNIFGAVEAELMIIDPFRPENVQPASYDVTLDNRIIFPDNSPRVLEGDSFILQPGEFMLASTVERIELPTSIAARVEGKSTLGRRGLLVHSTAGFIDPGFKGTITLELINVSKRAITLTAGMRIGQLCFFRLETPASAPYGDPKFASRYQNQDGPIVARFW